MLEQLIYVSRARDVLTSVLSVSDILDQARRNNSRHGVTGALAFTQDSFMQLIEGEASALDDLVTRLRADERHADIRIIGRAPIAERAFDGWAMVTPRFTPQNTEALAGLLKAAPAAMATYRQLLETMIAEQAEGLPSN